MDTIEKFYIYSETRNNNQINDKNTIKPNAILRTLVSMTAHRTLTDPQFTPESRPHTVTHCSLPQHVTQHRIM